MAKIYETDADLKRDRAEKRLHTAESRRDTLVTGGLVSALAGTTLVNSGASNLDMQDRGARNFAYASLIAGAVSVLASFVQFAFSLRAGSAVKHAREELEALGSEEVVLPQNAQEYIAAHPLRTDHTERYQTEKAERSSVAHRVG